MESKPATMAEPGKPAAAATGGPPSSSFPRPPLSSSSSSFPTPNSNATTTVSSSSSPATGRGGVSIGAPAHRPPQPFTTFGPSPPPSALHHQHQFVSMHRPPDPPPVSSTPQARATMGSSFAQLRPSSAPPPSRLAQTPLRPTPPPPSTSTFNSQRMPPPSSLTQHHMHSTIPSSPSPSFRPPLMQQQRPIQALQQRPYQAPLPHLQATPQNPSFPSQNPNPNRVPISGPIGPIALISSDASEQSDRILTKRTIHELFSQIDKSEKVEAEVEEVLIEVAEEFVESLTTFACSLAKHRKSSTLEAKDILLHAERNWNITLPGFSGDEIKMYKKQNVNDIHRERLALIKKTMGDPRRAYLASQQTPQNKP